jgi:hypothetical protein
MPMHEPGNQRFKGQPPNDDAMRDWAVANGECTLDDFEWLDKDRYDEIYRKYMSRDRSSD